MATPSTDPDSGPSEHEDDFAARMRAEEKEYSEGFDAAFKDFDWATVQPGQAELDWFNPRRAVSGGATRPGRTRKPPRQDGPQQPQPAEFLSAKQAAEIIGLHEKVIRRAIDDGELPASKVRSRIKIRRADLEKWIETNRVQPSVHDIEPWRSSG